MMAGKPLAGYLKKLSERILCCCCIRYR